MLYNISYQKNWDNKIKSKQYIKINVALLLKTLGIDPDIYRKLSLFSARPKVWILTFLGAPKINEKNVYT